MNSNVIAIVFGIISTILAAVGAVHGFKTLTKSRRRRRRHSGSSEVLPSQTSVPYVAYDPWQSHTTPIGFQSNFQSPPHMSPTGFESTTDVYIKVEMGVSVRSKQPWEPGLRDAYS
ncbi:hypothetical protein K440DRAFT_236811 [Wilcoxina mikolae CBS 423.85]|nr:hypothetical protein K440DRAFT_236811 [Wilcoxina mikolae CBS 423.85]